MKVTFTGEGGYPEERRKAKELLTVGQEYTIKDAQVRLTSSWMQLEEVEGAFNICMFDGVTVDDLMDPNCPVPVSRPQDVYVGLDMGTKPSFGKRVRVMVEDEQVIAFSIGDDNDLADALANAASSLKKLNNGELKKEFPQPA